MYATFLVELLVKKKISCLSTVTISANIKCITCQNQHFFHSEHSLSWLLGSCYLYLATVSMWHQSDPCTMIWIWVDLFCNKNKIQNKKLTDTFVEINRLYKLFKVQLISIFKQLAATNTKCCLCSFYKIHMFNDWTLEMHIQFEHTFCYSKNRKRIPSLWYCNTLNTLKMRCRL